MLGSPSSRWVVLACLALSTPVLAGCLAGSDDVGTTAAVPPPSPPVVVSDVLTLLDDGGFRITQPLDVILIGFEPGLGAELAKALEPEEVEHSAFTFPRDFPPERGSAEDTNLGHPVLPVAQYSVRQVDSTFASEFFAYVAGQALAEGVFDANAGEAWLAERLPAAGYPIVEARPPFVILHAGDELPVGHAWRYAYTHGYLEPVRTFGEKLPLLVTDVSARPDPYVTGYLLDRDPNSPPRGKAYDYPLPPGGSETLEALDELVVDATHFRFLKGAIYPITTKPCHQVTLILAVHATTVDEKLPGGRPAKEWVDLEGLKSGWENLTGDEVRVEFKILTLPQEEPVLDALIRGAGTGFTLDHLRWYIDENFAKLVEADPACEQYLGLTAFADLANPSGYGIAMYDVKRSHRIAFGIWPEIYRVADSDGPIIKAAGRSDPSRPLSNWINLLFSHEVGHILGQHHPQHLVTGEGRVRQLNSFESVWSVMSYQTVDRLNDFGKNDQAQWQRNRAGYAVAEAQALGLAETPEFREALEHLAQYHWNMGYGALAPLLAADAEDAGGGGEAGFLGDYHIVDQHRHPWFEGLLT